MNLWEERAARNESLFRDVNEQVRSLDRHAEPDEQPGFVCECSDETCAERLPVPLAAYESVRQNPRQFLVAPGHDGSFEHLVERREGYAIVEKEGAAGRLSEQTDPRP